MKLFRVGSDHAIRIVEQMEPDEAADVLSNVAPEQAEVVLAGLEDPDDSTGGLMTSEFLAPRRRMTAAEALQAIQDWQPEAETIYYLFESRGNLPISPSPLRR